jgi:hypothetical protein
LARYASILTPFLISGILLNFNLYVLISQQHLRIVHGNNIRLSSAIILL